MIWLVVSIASAQQPVVLEGAAPARQAGQEMKPSTLYLEENVHSAILYEDRRIIVRLPRHYQIDTSRRYPVLFKLEGDSGLKRYDDCIDILSGADVIPDMIVVAIPNARGQRNRDMTPPTLHQDNDGTQTVLTGEMGRGDRFLDFIEQELIPYVDNHYRTAAPRVLAGHSRSALLVLHSLLTKPDLFQGRFIFSAPLMREDQRLIVDTRAFLAKHRDHRSFVYFNWGEDENPGMGESHGAMKQLLTEQAPSGLTWVIERVRGADHQQTPVLALPSALRELFADAAVPFSGNRPSRAASER